MSAHTTTTIKHIPADALAWLRVNWHYIEALRGNVKNPNAPVLKALSREYRETFGRKLDKDIRQYITGRQ